MVEPRKCRGEATGLQSLANARGITLIELMVVTFILAMLAGGSVFMVGLITHGQLKDEAMRFSTAAQYTYNQAALNNRQYRLIIDLDENSYYTEVTDSDVVIDDSDEEAQSAFDEGLLPEEARQMELEREAERRGLFSEEEDDPFGISRRTGFQRAEESVIEPRTLDNGIVFETVRTESRPRAVRDGRVAIHFFPNGLQQQAHIVFHDPSTDARFTLVTEPLTGRIRAYSGEYEVPEDFGEEEFDG